MVDHQQTFFSGEWVLVTAAAGGVGIAAVQIAKGMVPSRKRIPERNFFTPPQSTIELGAKVIAAAGSADKIEIAKKYGGADYGINYSKPGWQKEVLDITKGHGVDVVYDPVGLVNGMRKLTIVLSN